MRSEPTREKVLAAIEHAFRGVQLEDGVSANMAEYHECPDAKAFRQLILESAQTEERNDWTRVSDETLESRSSIFYFSDPKGFRFYAPAFMRYAVTSHDVSAHFIVDGIVWALSPDHVIFKNTPFEDCFTSEQVAAVCTFLEYCVANNETLDGAAAAKNLQLIRQRVGGG